MKYNIYIGAKTIKNYKIKRSRFKKKYVMKINYIADNEYGVFETKTLEEMKEYEQYILDIMDLQMADFVNSLDDLEETFQDTAIQKYRRIKNITDITSLSLPIILSAIFKDQRNLIAYIPLLIINSIIRVKAREDAALEIKDDIAKYQIYNSEMDNFRDYSKYVTENQKSLTANNIDNYTLKQLQAIRSEIRNLKFSETNLGNNKIKQL